MSTRGRHTRAWHIRRLRAEWEEDPEQLVRDLHAENLPLTRIAELLELSYPELHAWCKELGLPRRNIPRSNATPAQDRLRQEFGEAWMFELVSDRALGMHLADLCGKYKVSNGFVVATLKRYAPELVGTPEEPIHMSPPRVSAKGRAKQSAAARTHNRELRRRRAGWFRDYTFSRAVSPE